MSDKPLYSVIHGATGEVIERRLDRLAALELAMNHKFDDEFGGTPLENAELAWERVLRGYGHRHDVMTDADVVVREANKAAYKAVTA